MGILSSLVVICIWAAIVLICIGLIGIAIAGIRSISYGKVEPLSIAIVAIPAVLLLVLGFLFGAGDDLTTAQAWARAGIWTTVVMFVLAMIGLLYTGVRGVFN